jgi:long-subunit fatty acid transport protein
LSIGLLRYGYDSRYTERLNDAAQPQFRSLTFNETYETEGVGLSGRFGVLYRFESNVRVGAAFHTPTNYRLTDTYNSGMRSDLNLPDIGLNGESVYEPAQPGRFEYRLRTPWRVNTGVSAVVPDVGLLTAEVDVVDYGSARYDFGSTDPATRDYERQVNRLIGQKYRTAVNVRLGGEYAYRTLRLRAGYGLFGSPFESGASAGTRSAHLVSGGIGFREQGFFMDLALSHQLGRSEFTPYVIENDPVPVAVDVRSTLTRVVLSVGFKF